MKPKHNAGFSLVEVLVAIVLLGTLVVPICSSLVLTFRMNEKTDSILQAQLAVSSAVETLMAEGIDEEMIGQKLQQNFDEYKTQDTSFRLEYEDGTGRFPEVSIHVAVIPDRFFPDAQNELPYTKSYDCYSIEVESNADDSVCVSTKIREKEGGA